MMEALIFDCDGVLVDTERDGHRVAFNRAFAETGLDVNWSMEKYRGLLKIAGGKERMRFWFDTNGWPEQISAKDELITRLHLLKTRFFMELVEAGRLPLRPGIMRIVDEAVANRIRMAVCSTSNEKSVNLIVEKLLGAERKACFNGIFAGDIVSRKKPDPEIYRLCATELNLHPQNCFVVEDSRNGLLAAKGAGFRCLITSNDYTKDEDFNEADLVVDELGEGANIQITIDMLIRYCM
jgi:HAD superfamily hydrolase (TIGR01509 family)